MKRKPRCNALQPPQSVAGSGSEWDLEFEAGTQGTYFGLRGSAEQVSRLVHEFARAKDIRQARATVEHRADAEFLLIKPARIIDVLDFAVELDARLEILVQAVSALPGIRHGVDRLGLAPDRLLPEQVERLQPVHVLLAHEQTQLDRIGLLVVCCSSRP